MEAKMIDRITASQQKALDQLRLISEPLYMEAIQVIKISIYMLYGNATWSVYCRLILLFCLTKHLVPLQHLLCQIMKLLMGILSMFHRNGCEEKSYV